MSWEVHPFFVFKKFLWILVFGEVEEEGIGRWKWECTINFYK